MGFETLPPQSGPWWGSQGFRWLRLWCSKFDWILIKCVLCGCDESYKGYILGFFFFFFDKLQRLYTRLIRLLLTTIRNLNRNLESTNAAKRVPHLHPTWPHVGCGIWCGCLRVGATSEFFFFFFSSDSHRLGLIRAVVARFMPNRLRFALNRPESGCIGHIGSYRPATDTVETSRKRPKQAKIGIESGWKSRNSHLRSIVMCFLPSSFFVLWIKA